jgi:SNF2 family DNA or RNA helicase
MQLTDYHAKYFAYELTKRCSSNDLEKLTASLLDAQVDLNPHQIDAALFAFQSPLSKGAILADEVGLGKTIEAGLILSQKWAERKRRILIIAPSNLRKQWNQELLDKFFLSSLILESQSFNQDVKRGNLNPFLQDEIIICSYQFARSKEAYLSRVSWDLVIIDEAHRLRNVYKPSNKIGNALKKALANVSKILLTATPLQNSLMELFGLVSIIDDYTFGDIKSFKNQFSRLVSENDFSDLKARLRPICKRTLRRQVLEYISYTNRIPITQTFTPSQNEQRLYDMVSEYLQRPNLYALPASQRQLMTLILRKLLASSTYAISGTLEALSNRLEGLISRQECAVTLDETISADFEGFEEIREEWSEYGDETGNEPLLSSEELDNVKEELQSLREFHTLAQNIIHNSKGQVLLTALKKGFLLADEKGGNRKALIFTESTRTQGYLKEILEKTEFKGKIVLFNGSNNDPESKRIYQLWLAKYKGSDRVTGSKTADMRSALVDYFKNEAEIMIATEAAAEGINLQFCSIVVNYDLPWNPQRIEQRIGRCHRYGQKHDVVVVNFLNKKNAADQRVYQLLDAKFKLFSGVFGASDEVLGSIESGVDFEKRIAQIYQFCRTEEEIQQAFDNLQKEMEPEIDQQLSSTRQKLLENFDEEVTEKLRINLQTSQSSLSKYENWLWNITEYFLAPYAEFSLERLQFVLKSNPFAEEKIHEGPYRIGKDVEDENVYRIGHPLAQKIIQRFRSLDLPEAEIEFDYTRTGKKISILEPFIGLSGWLSVANLTIASFEIEDHLIFCGITDDGVELDSEQCQRLFSLDGTVQIRTCYTPPEIKERIGSTSMHYQKVVEEQNMERNSRFFDQEIEKLDKWTEDRKKTLELELKDLDIEIKTRRTEAKKILRLEEKVAAQRKIKDLEKKRNELRYSLYHEQDQMDERKEALIEEIEARMRQDTEKQELFLIRWSLV